MEIITLMFLNIFAHCNINPIYCQIKQNNPKITNSYALEISKTINRMEKKHNISGRLLAAILMQESAYKLCTTSSSKDFGIAQINHKTVDSYRFDMLRLINDLEYSIEAGATVLSWFKKKYSHKDKDWYTRYNCGTKGSTKRSICQNYKAKVERYL